MSTKEKSTMRLNSITYVLVTVLSVVAMAMPASVVLALDDQEVLSRYVADLKKKPDAQELRTRIIAHVQTMRTPPAVPDDAMRAYTRGKALVGMASTKEGFEKAIPELVEATINAPWFADAYDLLAQAQEKAGLFADAIESLNFYLLIAPRAKNAADLKKKIYELEVYAEQAHQEVPAPVKLPKAEKKPEAGKQNAPQTAAPSVPEKKVNTDLYVGSWYGSQAVRRGSEDAQIHAFTLRKNTKGDLIASPPRRVTGTIGSVTKFEIAGASLRLQITWKSSSIPNYWKTEDYNLDLSDDGTKLSGSYEMKSSGVRGDFSDKREFTKQ